MNPIMIYPKISEGKGDLWVECGKGRNEIVRRVES